MISAGIKKGDTIMKNRNFIGKAAAMLVCCAVAALSGCGTGNDANVTGNGTSSEAAQTDAPDGTAETTKYQVTAVVYEVEQEPDTTIDSILYLEDVCPLFAKYLNKRTGIPISLYSVTETNGERYEYGLILKDTETMAEYSVNSNGYKSRVIYDSTKAYEIDENERMVYYTNMDNDYLKSLVSGSIMKVPIDQVQTTQFSQETEVFKGTEYDKVTLTPEEGEQSFYYFDKATGDIKYIVTGDSVTEINVLINDIYDESLFNIPTDYDTMSYDDYIAGLRSEAIASAEAEEAAAAQTAESSASE